MRLRDNYCFSKASHILYVGWLLKFSRACMVRVSLEVLSEIG